MREFAQGFYKGRAWQQCRDGYIAQQRVSVSNVDTKRRAKKIYREGCA